MSSYEEPPSLQDSKGSRSPARNSGVNPCDSDWIPLWRRGLLPSVAFNGDISCNSLHQHKVVDLVFGEDD